MGSIHQVAHEYAARGWRVLPLKPRGKAPLLDRWQFGASNVAQTIDLWWGNLHPDANLGVQLGPRSGIVDVECDSPDAERALIELFDGDPPVAPTFQAARGKHRLFAWHDDIPPQAVVKYHGVEFRLGGGDLGAQSVFPPSIHPSGQVYRWLVTPDEVDICPLPPALVRRLREHCGAATLFDRQEPSARPAGKRDQGEWKRLASGVGEGERNESAAAVIGKALANLADPFDNSAISFTFTLVQTWNRANKPPLADKELRTTFQSILKSHRERATTDQYDQAFAKFCDDSIDSPIDEEPSGDDNAPPPQPIDSPPAKWRLVIVEAKPRIYKLYSPIWAAKAPGGCIRLDASEMRNADAIGRAALEQADVWIEPDFRKAWHGSAKRKGLAAQLIDTAEFEDAPAEQRRDLVVAEWLWGALSRARQIEPDDEGNAEPDSRGVPTLMPDGSVVFRFSVVWEDMARSDDKVKRTELSELLKLIKAEETQVGARHQRVRLKRLSPDSVQTLRELIGIGE